MRMTADMRAAFMTGRREIALREIARPTPGAGEVIVDVHACGICGSDLHVYDGDAPLPRVCPGHEICGRIARDSPAGEPGSPVVIEPIYACGRCPTCRVGEPNLCRGLELIGSRRDGGFADAVVAPLASVHRLPDGLDLDAAVLTEPLAVAAHGFGRAARVPRGEILVLGGGTIGLLTAFVAVRSGAAVTIAVRHPQQRALALRLGVGSVVEADRDAVLATARERSPDVVFETVGGRADTLELALEAVRAGGTIVTLGVFSRALTVHPIRFLAKEATLTASMMYSRGDGASDFGTALELLRAHRNLLAPLVTHRVPLERIDDGFQLAADKRSGAVKVVVEVERRQ